MERLLLTTFRRGSAFGFYRPRFHLLERFRDGPSSGRCGRRWSRGDIAFLATIQNSLDDRDDPQDIDKSVAGYLFFAPNFYLARDEKDVMVDPFQHMIPDIAPSLFFVGESDPQLPVSQKLGFALKKTGARADLLVSNKMGHWFLTDKNWCDYALFESDRFLYCLGILSGPPLVKKPPGFGFNPAKSVTDGQVDY